MHLLFDEKIMKKTTVCESFVISDGEYQVSIEDESDAIEAVLGEECWVFNCVECEKYNGHEQVFAYFPKIGYASVVLSRFINQ